MKTYVIISAIVIISLFIMASILYYRRKRLRSVCLLNSLTKYTQRKLSQDEYHSIENYLAKVLRQANNDNQHLELPAIPTKNDRVYTINNNITRFSLSADSENEWHYYIDTTEVYLPHILELYIQETNVIDVVFTARLPIIIGLNGHSLTDAFEEYDYLPDNKQENLPAQAAILKNSNSDVEFLGTRKETAQEYHLHHSSGMLNSILLLLGVFMWFIALYVPAFLIHGLLFLGIFSFLTGCFLSVTRRPYKNKLRDIQRYCGVPKRWGLFGNFDYGQKRSISLGGIDLIYPEHWGPYLHHSLDVETHIDMYSDQRVIRQGSILSLHDEAIKFPTYRYFKNIAIACVSALLLALLWFYQPVNLPMKLSLNWITGTDVKVTTSFSELQKMPLHVGDFLEAKGVGMCYMPPNLSSQNKPSFAPFDCSGIYWNNTTPLPMPESEQVELAADLLLSLNHQLHASPTNRRINESLNDMIAKSGMSLLDDFSDLVIKTDALCGNDNNDCIRLKNALVNLGNSHDWSNLLARAESGSLNNTNVLLRPASAEALEKLVDATTSSFITREIESAAVRLNSPPPGGVLLISDEGKQLVEYMTPANNKYDTPPLEQWRSLQRLSDVLLHTPFRTQGIVTEVSVDANGTRHITLHSQPDNVMMARYLGSCILLAMLALLLLVNSVLAIVRRRKSCQRIAKIQHYYDECFDSSTSP